MLALEWWPWLSCIIIFIIYSQFLSLPMNKRNNSVNFQLASHRKNLCDRTGTLPVQQFRPIGMSWCNRNAYRDLFWPLKFFRDFPCNCKILRKFLTTVVNQIYLISTANWSRDFNFGWMARNSWVNPSSVWLFGWTAVLIWNRLTKSLNCCRSTAFIPGNIPCEGNKAEL